MAEEKKEKNINTTPNFLKYERERISIGGKALYSKVFRFGRKASLVSEEQAARKVKEQGTLKTVWGVFKEAWTKTGKDFRKAFGFKVGESVCQGCGPYCQSLLFGSLSGLATGAAGATAKFFGVAGLEVIRKRMNSFCGFKVRMASLVLNDTHANATTGAVYEDILHKPRPYFKDNAPAALSGVVGEIASAKNTLLNTSVDCLSKAVIFGISSASLFAIDPKLATAVLGVTVVVAEFGGYMNNVFRKLNSKVSSLGHRVGKENSDSIKNTPLVQDTNRVSAETTKMRSRLDKSSKAMQKVKYASGKGYLTMGTVINVLMEGAIMAAASVDVAKTGDIGRFALISMASWQMMWSGEMLSELWNRMQSGTHKLIDATKKLVTPKELERVVGKEKLAENDTKISVQNVSFAYPLVKDVTNMSLVEVMDREGEIQRTEGILKDMSVEFDKGGLTAVVGTSGNGKSTLMSLIRHDYDVEAGQIFIGDKEIRTLSDEELNAQIAFVDQKVHFFDESIGYNLKYFKPDATDEELMEACRKAGFDADVDKFNDGLSHRIGQDGSKLSGGQQQRLALARAFLTDKPIVIMDEPTTGLDPKLSLRVVKALKDMAEEKTVIVVTHNPTEVALADRVVVVENGTVTADGKPMDLIQTSEFLRETLTKEDIKNKRKLYNNSVNGENPMQAVAEVVNAEADGKVLSDAERKKKRQLLEAHKRAYVGVRKNALKSERIKEGKPLPEKKERNIAVNVSWKQSKEM
ncbi:MAG: ABC transporter ATP-binding protein/permease [Acetobacter sp.]|nr:ABC transporter ATP-binding protein/permease [Acetobacter sp.]